MRLDEIEEMKFLNKGHTSRCYDLGNGTILKLFNEVKKLSEIEKFKYLLKYKNESFLFPFKFLYDEDHFSGYITKKSLGQTLEDSFNSLGIEKLSTDSILLEHNIKQISNGKILLDDFHEGNIMYDKEKIEVIDPDFYKNEVSLSCDDIKEKNLNYYKLVIAGLFKRGIKCTKETRYIIDRITKYEYLTLSASEMMIKIKEDMEKYYKEKIDTIDDLHTILRR